MQMNVDVKTNNRVSNRTGNITVERLNTLLQLAATQSAVGDFPSAVKTIKKATEGLLRTRDYNKYLQCQNWLIIMHTEMENFNEIENIRHEIGGIISQNKQADINYTRFHYAVGNYFLRQDNYSQAQAHFDQALVQNLKMQKEAIQRQDTVKQLISKIDVCYVAYGFTCLLVAQGQIPSAVAELKKLEELIQNFNSFYTQLEAKKQAPVKIDNFFYSNVKEEVQSLELSYNILKADILSIEQKYSSAEELYWLCYQQVQLSYRKKYMTVNLFYFLGKNYMSAGNYEKAVVFFNLVKKSDPKVFKLIHRKTNQALTKLKKHITSNYDIVVNLTNKVIMEKQKGSIDIKNQFVLLDMLMLFMDNPGVIYSKETLVEKIWKQKYNPNVHNNKIYVTIKRLRELVEPDHKKPKYIFRAKEGYYINQNVKTLLKRA